MISPLYLCDHDEENDLEVSTHAYSLFNLRGASACHDRGIRTMNEPEWLEVIGHPTIPHVQSLRAPPAQVALHSNKENLIGLTNRNASKRYLQKLQKERERNQEVLAECVDNLPIVIRQMVYPEKPSPKLSWRLGTGNSATSPEKKFRVGKQHDNFWQDNIEHWVQSEHVSNATEAGRQQKNGNSQNAQNAHERKHTCTSSHHSDKSDTVVLSKEFVHHQGFQGSPESQSTNLKYKFGKKKATQPSENQSQQQSTFRPKGFGSLYDELEFERRYKKVFDLNKHIHFVHSNFVTGQRLYKRNKLPPIGHVPSIQSDPSDSRDIFAIMSVQRFNHPPEPEVPRAPVTTPGSNQPHPQPVDGVPSQHVNKLPLEITQDLSDPVGFVPGTIKSSGSSPFDGISGTLMQKEGGYRLSLVSRENDSALGTLTEETSRPTQGDDTACSASERSVRTDVSRKTRTSEDIRARTSPRRSRPTTKEDKFLPKRKGLDNDYKSVTTKENTFEEQEPFNISVHVEIKPKDPNINGGDDLENVRARERRLPIIEQSESHVSDDYDKHDEVQKDNDKIVYATKFENEFSPRSEDSEDGLKVIRPKHISMNTNQFGFVTHKVQYPERFVLKESLAEEDETDLENENDSGNENIAAAE